jgi:hypothetical protein
MVVIVFSLAIQKRSQPKVAEVVVVRALEMAIPVAPVAVVMQGLLHLLAPEEVLYQIQPVDCLVVLYPHMVILVAPQPALKVVVVVVVPL